eukprot:13067824-Heterocapsa_arctica.AAC.1
MECEVNFQVVAVVEACCGAGSRPAWCLFDEPWLKIYFCLDGYCAKADTSNGICERGSDQA